MNNVTIFWMQLVISLVVFGVAALWYAWPALARIPRNQALMPLLWIQVPRYVGMTLLVTGMVDPTLPIGFRFGAAYGDLVAASLAFAAILALRADWRFAVPLVWAANSWGFVDLLNGVRGVVQLNIPGFHLASFWYVYIFYAPLVILSHLMIFRLLLRPLPMRAT